MLFRSGVLGRPRPLGERPDLDRTAEDAARHLEEPLDTGRHERTIPVDGAAGTIRATDGEDALDTTTLLGIAHAERARLGRVVQFASPGSWEAPSPCQGWRNRDVMAHLAAQETAAVQVVRGEAPEEFDAFRAANGGEFWVDGFNESAVRVRADVPTRRILEDWGRAAELLLADLAGRIGGARLAYDGGDARCTQGLFHRPEEILSASRCNHQQARRIEPLGKRGSVGRCVEDSGRLTAPQDRSGSEAAE